MLRALAFSSAIAMLSGACMSDTMDHGNRQMGLAISDARTETSRHTDLCNGALTMHEVTAELDRHEQAMNGIMGRMDRAMGTMHGMNCGSGMDGMMQTVSQMKTAMQAHRDRIDAAVDVPAAHDECTNHRDQMMGLCASAEERNDGMSCM